MSAVTDQERYRRVVEDGSKRKRDLAGYERVKAAEVGAMERRFAETRRVSQGVLATVKERLRASVPGSTYRLWIEPLRAVDAQSGILYLTAPEGVRAWAERRYSSLIAEALADTGFEDVCFIAAGEWSA